MRFLFVDRITQLVPGELVRGIKHITHEDLYLYQDDSGRSCFASSLIGETLGQLAAWNVMVANDFNHRPVAGVVARARLHRSAYVGETLLLESFIDSLDESAVQYHSVARIGNDIVFTIDGALGPLLPMPRFINDEDIRRQFAEINRPGEWICATPGTEPPQTGISGSQLSAYHLPLVFDHVLHLEPGVSITAEKRITRSAPYFPDHFPNNPVLPLTVLLEAKLNLARLFLKQAEFAIPYQIQEIRKIKMNEFVYPGDVLICHASVLKRDEQQLILRYRSEVNGKRVCILDVVMTATGTSI